MDRLHLFRQVSITGYGALMSLKTLHDPMTTISSFAKSYKHCPSSHIHILEQPLFVET